MAVVVDILSTVVDVTVAFGSPPLMTAAVLDVRGFLPSSPLLQVMFPVVKPHYWRATELCGYQIKFQQAPSKECWPEAPPEP